MDDFEIEYEINEALSFFQKGHSAIQVRKSIIDKGITDVFASKIAKGAYIKFLHKNANVKIVRGLFWFFGGLITSLIRFHRNVFLTESFTISLLTYILIFCTFWGLFKILAGISDKRSVYTL